MEEMNATIEPRHAEFELEHGLERGTSASRNDGSDADSNDTDSDDHGKGKNGRLSTSKNEESVANSDGDYTEARVLASASKKEEGDIDSSSESSCGDVEIEQGEISKSSGDLPTDVLDTQALTGEEVEEENDEGRDGGTNTQEMQSSPEAFAAEPALPIDEVVNGSTEFALKTSDDSNKQFLDDNAGAPISKPKEINMQETQSRPEALAIEREQSLRNDEVGKGSGEIVIETADDSDKQVLGDSAEAPTSISEDRTEGDQSVESQRSKAPFDQENKPSYSRKDITRDIAPEMVELDEHSLHDPLETEDEYGKKGFTCGGNTEDDDEEHLREHWMRTLQTSTSTGEIVEEIVKVLKHHQKTHDLLCPVCGSCVTRRVILRKRKRSSLISVDRYQDPLDEAEVQEQGSSRETMEAVEEQATQEYRVTEAFGCLSCFSLFFAKGCELLNRLQPDVGSESFNCLPFFFPPYPWGMTQMRPEIPEVAPQSSLGADAGVKDSSTILEAVSQHEISEEVPQLPREGRDCTCGLIPGLLPDYPWGSFMKDEGAYNMQTQILTQAQIVEETEGKEAEDKRSSCDVVGAVLPNYPWGMTTESPEVPEDEPTLSENRLSRRESIQSTGSAILPQYPWGVCSQNHTLHEQNGSAPMLEGAADRDCTCGLGPAMWPKFPWGQTLSTADEQDQTAIEEVKSYTEQETKIEARITSKTDVFTVTSSKTTYPGEKPPQNIKTTIPQETSQTIKHVKLDQTVTIIDNTVTVEDVPAIKGSSLVSLPSTGYAYLEEISEEAQLTGKGTSEEPPESEIQEDSQSEAKSENISQSVLEETVNEPGKTGPHLQPPFPSFQWSVGKLDGGDLTTPLLQGSVEPEAETVISVLKPSPAVQEPKSRPWLSIFKVSKPSDEEGITAPLLSAPVVQPQIPSVTETVVDVPPADLGGTTVGTATSTAAAVPAEKKEADDWDILKSIVYGGLDISVASLGVTSSAAGGNAITRTVVYMGIATLLSGLIGFYHNVLNLYHYHRDHYTAQVGVSLMLHGTVALISYVIFGLLSPLLYAFSYRETDNRDDKFILCCVVTIVAVTALSLGKAKVSNKRYIRTPCAYLLGGVLAALVGYLTGEHVAELLEEWGL